MSTNIWASTADLDAIQAAIFKCQDEPLGDAKAQNKCLSG